MSYSYLLDNLEHGKCIKQLKRYFMLSLSGNYQADTFNCTSRYLDDLLNIDNPYFKHMVSQTYPTWFQLNKASAAFWS